MEKFVINLDAAGSRKMRPAGEFTSEPAAKLELKSLRKKAPLGDRYKLFKITTELIDV